MRKRKERPWRSTPRWWLRKDNNKPGDNTHYWRCAEAGAGSRGEYVVSKFFPTKREAAEFMDDTLYGGYIFRSKRRITPKARIGLRLKAEKLKKDLAKFKSKDVYVVDGGHRVTNVCGAHKRIARFRALDKDSGEICAVKGCKAEADYQADFNDGKE